MQSTFTFNSTTGQKQVSSNAKLKSITWNGVATYIPIVIYAVFLIVSLALTLYVSLVFAGIFFIVGSVGLTTLYIWNYMKDTDMEVSFQIDVDQTELERELYEEVA